MKLSQLTDDQFIGFVRVIERGVKDDWTAKATIAHLQVETHHEFGERQIQRYMERVREGKTIKRGETEEEKLEKQCSKSSWTGTGSEAAEYEGFVKKRITTVEEAIQKSGADMTKWDVAAWECTSWEVGAKTKSEISYNSNQQVTEVNKTMTVTPLWRVSVRFSAKKGWTPDEFRAILVKDLKALAPSYRKMEYEKPNAPILAELSIFDAHFGKLAWSPESGQDYDLKICEQRYMNAARDLIRRAMIYNPERFVVVLGNDMFHTDHKEATTSGTPMDTDGRWQKAFKIGVKCSVTILEEIAETCPVDVLIVPGNHDREKAFCLGEVLDARFHQHHGVNVMNDPDLYAYYRWGKVLLGFVHGDRHTSEAKRKELPIQMLNDRPQDCAETVWREFHLGHFHSEREEVWKYRSVSHVRDFAVRILPSLSSTDAWHREEGYCSVLAAELHLYHKDHGRWGYLVHQAEG